MCARSINDCLLLPHAEVLEVMQLQVVRQYQCVAPLCSVLMCNIRELCKTIEKDESQHAAFADKRQGVIDALARHARSMPGCAKVKSDQWGVFACSIQTPLLSCNSLGRDVPMSNACSLSTSPIPAWLRPWQFGGEGFVLTSLTCDGTATISWCSSSLPPSPFHGSPLVHPHTTPAQPCIVKQRDRDQLAPSLSQTLLDTIDIAPIWLTGDCCEDSQGRAVQGCQGTLCVLPNEALPLRELIVVGPRPIDVAWRERHRCVRPPARRR
jgi:hypothetical protein